MNQKITSAIVLLVTVIWSLSMVYDAVNSAYDPPAPIHGAFMLVLGSIVGLKVAGKEAK